MFGAVLAGAMNRKPSFDGAFTTTSGSSPVTSSTRTCTHGGKINFNTVATDGGTPQYSLNAGAFTNITEGLTLTLVKGDTLAVRATLASAGLHASFGINSGSSSSGPLVESVTLTRS